MSLRIPEWVWRLCVAVMAACAFAGCIGQRPQTIAQHYVDALKQRQYGDCYVMLAEEDRQARTPDRFVAAIPLAPDVSISWFKLVLEATTYQVGQKRREGPLAIVPVIVTTPDLARFERSVEAYVGPDGEPIPVARDALKNGEYPKITYEDNITMIKERHRWRIKVDYAAREAASAERRKALESYYCFDFGKAEAGYNEALALLRKSNATGARGLEFLYGRELAEIMLNQADRLAEKNYTPKLKLDDVGMKMSAAHRPAVFGKVTNQGNRSIDGIRMEITFFDGRGQRRHAIFSEQHTSISTPLQFTNFTIRAMPLAPGETRPFGLELAAPDKVETAGDPFVAVSGIIFTPPGLMPAEVSAPSPNGHEQQEE